MIRIAEERDVPAMLAIYAPFVRDTTVSFEYDVPEEAEFLRRFRSVTEQFPWLVWEEEGCVLGYAYAGRPFERAAYSWCAEPSIYILPEAQGRGIGRKLYTALEWILKNQGYQVLYAWITGENTGSVLFHERMGYKISMKLEKTGYKFERWCDLIWMEKRLNFVENPVEFPTSWGAFVRNNQNLCNILYSLSLSQMEKI